MLPLTTTPKRTFFQLPSALPALATRLQLHLPPPRIGEFNFNFNLYCPRSGSSSATSTTRSSPEHTTTASTTACGRYLTPHPLILLLDSTTRIRLHLPTTGFPGAHCNGITGAGAWHHPLIIYCFTSRIRLDLPTYLPTYLAVGRVQVDDALGEWQGAWELKLGVEVDRQGR
jgi:hypothetical protein